MMTEDHGVDNRWLLNMKTEPSDTLDNNSFYGSKIEEEEEASYGGSNADYRGIHDIKRNLDETKDSVSSFLKLVLQSNHAVPLGTMPSENIEPMNAADPLNAESSASSATSHNADVRTTTATRRPRSRRNPVWKFFRVDDRVASCMNCDYSTRSAYSTNLKVHLKSHHPALYEEVLLAGDVMDSGALSPQNLNGMLGVPSPNSEGKSDYDSERRDSRPPTRSDQISPQSVGGTDSGQLSAHDSFMSFPSLNTGYFSHNNILSTNLENIFRNTSAFGANMTPSMLDMTQAFVNLAAKVNAGRTEGGGAPSFEDEPSSECFRTTKRKRLRRHPVWRFFKDVDEKTVGCVMCNFKTRSAFSTNLKMHLRAHHKEQYLSVMEMELEQCHLESSVSHSIEPTVNQLDGGGDVNGLRRLKRKRKSVEEIQGIINKCKVNLAKERQRRCSIDPTAARIDENIVWSSSNTNAQQQQRQQVSAPPANANVSSNNNAANSLLSALSILRTLQAKNVVPSESNYLAESQMLQSQPFDNGDANHSMKTSTEQLNSLIGVFLKNKGCDSNNNSNTVIHDSQRTQGTNQEGEGTEVARLDDVRCLFEFCSKNDNEMLRSVVLKQAIDLILKRIVEALGSTKILTLPAFRLLISALSPDYDWNHIDQLQ